jgi:hypothetical protein
VSRIGPETPVTETPAASMDTGAAARATVAQPEVYDWPEAMAVAV